MFNTKTFIEHNALPQYKMYKMGLANTVTCSQCTMGTTDYFHALWACKQVHCFWDSLKYEKALLILKLKSPREQLFWTGNQRLSINHCTNLLLEYILMEKKTHYFLKRQHVCPRGQCPCFCASKMWNRSGLVPHMHNAANVQTSYCNTRTNHSQHNHYYLFIYASLLVLLVF